MNKTELLIGVGLIVLFITIQLLNIKQWIINIANVIGIIWTIKVLFFSKEQDTMQDVMEKGKIKNQWGKQQ